MPTTTSKVLIELLSETEEPIQFKSKRHRYVYNTIWYTFVAMFWFDIIGTAFIGIGYLMGVPRVVYAVNVILNS